MGTENQAALNSCAGSHTMRRMKNFGAYFVFGMWLFIIHHQFTDHDFSLVLTMSSIVQCLGFGLLSIKVRSYKNVAGLSSKSLEMYIIFFVFRLSSTCFKNGYLPIDRSGDWMYQFADSICACIVLQLLYTMHKTFPDSYTSQHDTLDIFKAIPACMFLAYFIKGDLNASPFFDWVWAVSLLLDTICLLPQLWLLTKMGGKVESMTAHFVACICVSRACAFCFWLYGYSEIKPNGANVNVVGYAVLVAHSIQLLLCADFMYYYVKGMCSKSGRAVVLPTIEV